MTTIILISILGAACITLLIRKRCNKVIAQNMSGGKTAPKKARGNKLLSVALILLGTALASAAFAHTEENKPPAPKDLALEWANFTEEGIAFSIKNDGETDITGRLETLFEWLQCGEAKTCGRTKNVFTLVREENIGKGERLILESKNIAELKVWIQNKPFGVDRVRIEIDPANKIKEGNETNNLWEETPISPRTSGEGLAKRDEFLEDSYGNLKVLPGNKLYVLKDVWRNMLIALTLGKEKKIQKRLELIRERLVEIQKLAELGEGKEIQNTLTKVQKEWERAKMSMQPEQVIQEGLRIQLMLEDVENNAAEVDAENVRKELQKGIAENIRTLKSDEEKYQAVQEGLEKQNKGPFFSIKQIKTLRFLENLLPEEKSLQEIEKELVDTLELRFLYLPKDIQGGLGEYAASIHKDENEARKLLGHIQETAGGELRKAIEEIVKLKEVPEKKPATKEVSKKSVEPSEEKLKDVETKEPEEEKTVCTAEYDPVCGEDDVTYANACVAEEQNKIKIAEKGECKLPKPDLYVKGAKILPKDPRENDFLTIGANVVNDGGTAQKLFRTRMRIDADINGIYDVIPNEYPLNLIRTSSTKSIAWENVWEAKEGTHRIELCVDSGRAIAELNEENNCTLLAFEVGPKATSTQTMATSTDTVATSTNTLSTSTGVGN